MYVAPIGENDYDPRSFSVLNVRVDAVQIPEVIARIESWIRERESCHYIAVTGMRGLTESQRDTTIEGVLNSADLVVPDGMPLVWIGRLRGYPLLRRVYGPELMLEFCEATARKGYRHFLYGGSPESCKRLARTLRRQFPGISIVGSCSPPFRPLTERENAELDEIINRASPDIFWVGLSTPKQERWMHDHQAHIRAPVLIGVGAAFDINSGTKKRAPQWMREHGLELLFDLVQEPRCLWHRYLFCGWRLVSLVGLEFLGAQKPQLGRGAEAGRTVPGAGPSRGS